MSWVLSLVINWLLIGYLWRDIATGADGCRHSALTVYKCHDLVCPGVLHEHDKDVVANGDLRAAARERAIV